MHACMYVCMYVCMYALYLLYVLYILYVLYVLYVLRRGVLYRELMGSQRMGVVSNSSTVIIISAGVCNKEALLRRRVL